MKFHHKAHFNILMLRVQPSNIICITTIINIIDLCETKYAGMIDTIDLSFKICPVLLNTLAMITHGYQALWDLLMVPIKG